MSHLNSNLFKCKCDSEAEWLVWYKDCGGLYNYRCANCTFDDMVLYQDTEYPVVCIRSIYDAIPSMLNARPGKPSEDTP